jgi:hypothetical protein
MEVIILVVLLLIIIVLLVWGGSGGVTRQQQSLVQANAEIVRQWGLKVGMNDPEVHVDWPQAPGAPPRQAMVLDRANARLAFADMDASDMWSIFEVDPKEILAIDLAIDDETVSRVSRPKQIGAAVVGGLLAGNAGAIIGGLSTGQRSSESVTRIALRFTMDVSDVPVVEFCFWDRRSSNGWTGLGPEQISQIAGAAKRWSILLERFMEQHAGQQ